MYINKRLLASSIRLASGNTAPEPQRALPKNRCFPSCTKGAAMAPFSVLEYRAQPVARSSVARPRARALARHPHYPHFTRYRPTRPPRPARIDLKP